MESMAVQRKIDRLAPPLMFAFREAHQKRDAKKKIDLRDEAGERVLATRRASTRAPVSESGLRREVMRDLVDLMNTTNLASVDDLEDFPEVRASVLNYGLPDLTHRTLEENRISNISDEIETALARFEPRLARGSIRARRDETVGSEELRLRFLVAADLLCEPVNVPVEFVAELEFDTGKIKIERA
jgi:type VI secretion system protein ImpF